MTKALPRILCVDDEPNVLRGLRRSLRGHFDVVTANGGIEGLEILRADSGFKVVVSDMRMPEMDGVDFLSTVRARVPDATRVLLTGYADVEAAIDAVNEGNIFRFLSKPCPTNVLVRALRESVEQNRLITAERVLLRKTVVGCIKTLSTVLSLANPAAFGRATRAQKDVTALAQALQLKVQWEVEAAALLSQIGCVTLPPQVASKLYQGEALTGEERAMTRRIPAVAASLISAIPRLEEVERILAYQSKRFDGGGLPADDVMGDALPVGARMLKIVLDYDHLISRGNQPDRALDTLRGRHGSYDPGMLRAFANVKGCRPRQEVREVRLRELGEGMVFAEDLTAGKNCVILVARGQTVTLQLMERIWNFSRRMSVNEPIRVVIDGTSAQHRERPAKERREMATAEAPDAVPSTERMTIPIRRRTGRLPEKKAPGRSTMTERTRMRLLKGGKRRVV